MTLEEYLKDLKKLVEENPNALKMEVVTSRDDEGNGFNRVFYAPGIGRFEDGDFEGGDSEPNAVCLN